MLNVFKINASYIKKKSTNLHWHRFLKIIPFNNLFFAIVIYDVPNAVKIKIAKSDIFVS